MALTKKHDIRKQTRRLQKLLREHGIDADVEDMTPDERRIVDRLFPD